MKTVIVLPVSRPKFLRRVFTALEFMNCNAEDIDIFVYVDGDHQLFQMAERFVMGSKFRHKTTKFRNRGNANASSVRGRRQRIADIHNEIRHLLPKYDYVFLLEDDTIVLPSAYKNLMAVYGANPHAGLVTGVELGRWGYLHAGLWLTDNPYKPTYIESPKLGSGVEKIDSSGLYCMLTQYKLYKEHEFKPYEKILGPDFDYGIELRKKGYNNYVDYNVKCIHATNREDIKVEGEIVQVRFDRDGDDWLHSVR